MAILTLDEVESLLRNASTTEALFAAAPYPDLIRATLPERHPEDGRAEVLFQQIQQRYHQLDAPPIPVRGPRRTYTLWRLLAAGDVADVHFATAVTDPDTAAETYFVLKASRVRGGDRLLDAERQALERLRDAAKGTSYAPYLPALAESFPAWKDFPRRVNVFAHELGFHTLEEVHQRHPALDGRHLAWIFNRLLTVLGFCHRQGIIHGAVLPGHVLLHAGNHGVQLVGWGQSGERGRPVSVLSTRYREWYPPEVLKRQPAGPATDLFLAARCLVYLAGGDPLRNTLPDAVPPSMRRFLGTCLLPGPGMRPDDAWALFDEFRELLRQLYGPPKFHPLLMS